MCDCVYMNAPIKPLQYKGNTTLNSQNANILHLQFHIPRFMALHNNVQSAKRSDIFATCVQSTCPLHRCWLLWGERAPEVLHNSSPTYSQSVFATINLANKVDQKTKMAKQEQHFLQVKHTRWTFCLHIEFCSYVARVHSIYENGGVCYAGCGGIW